MPPVNSTLKWGEDQEKFDETFNKSSAQSSKKNCDEFLFDNSDSNESSYSSSEEEVDEEEGDDVDEEQTSFLNNLFSNNRLSSDTKRIKEMLEKNYKLKKANNSSDNNKFCSNDSCFDRSFCGEITSERKNLTNEKG